MPRTTRQELIEENQRLLDALEEARDQLDDVLDDYSPDADEPDEE